MKKDKNRNLRKSNLLVEEELILIIDLINIYFYYFYSAQLLMGACYSCCEKKYKDSEFNLSEDCVQII